MKIKLPEKKKMMTTRKLVFVASLAMMLAAAMHAQSQGQKEGSSNDLQRQATTLVTGMAAGQFSPVEARYNPAMKAALPEGKLSAVWSSLLQQAGAFQSITGTRQEDREGFHAVFVSCQFARQKMDVKMVFDSQGLVAGLFFVPAAAPPPSAAKEDYVVKPANVAGDWLGTLEAGARKLRLVFHLVNSADGLKATMDSPDQSAFGLAASSAQLTGVTLKIEMKQYSISYEGVVSRDFSAVQGTFIQGGSIPLTLKRVENKAELAPARRPQDPVRPFPYREEDVSYDNQAQGNRLAATLTLPQGNGPFPAVVLITGSGPQDRDESLMGHKPFLVLSDYLTRCGIAVLRADDRGIGKSTGVFASATAADFATDAEAGIAYLKTRPEVNKKMIGLVGHSEGGVIAPMVAARNHDVAFIVMMAGSGLPGDQIIAAQSGAITEEKTGSHEKGEKAEAAELQLLELAKRSQSDPASNKEFRDRLMAIMPEGSIDQAVRQMQSPWYLYFLNYDPATALRKVTVPVLAINGSKDLQVSSKRNLPAIRKALESAGNTHIDVEELPGLNHLFQTAKTGSVEEYSQIEETIAPVALEKIAGWIQKTASLQERSVPISK